MKVVKNYVITHKDFNVPSVNTYTPLQVGTEGKNKISNFLCDNVGENISKKNKNYCELTGIYWIWKNDKNSDIIGISHYRRYFTKQVLMRNKNKILNDVQINKIFDDGYDIIVPKYEIYRENAIEQYSMESGYKEDFEKIRDIIKCDHSEYLKEFDRTMTQNHMRQFNMMIMKRKDYDDYCTWLFDILFKLEKEIDLSNRNAYQQRIYGFLSERLFNVWLNNKKFKIYKCRVINTDTKWSFNCKVYLLRLKNELIYMYRKGRRF